MKNVFENLEQRYARAIELAAKTVDAGQVDAHASNLQSALHELSMAASALEKAAREKAQDLYFAQVEPS